MKNIYYGFIIIVFLIASAPFWGMSFYDDSKENSENRALSSFPKFDFLHIKKFISDINNYISDRHAFRSELSNAYMTFMLDAMNESPLNEQVVIGLNDWYYLGNSYDWDYNSSLGIYNYDVYVEEVVEEIKGMKLFCDSLNVDFYFAIAPDKAKVYKEYLPIKSNNRELLKYLITKYLYSSSINIIDLGEYIYPKKDSILLYYKTDSHWNKYGGLLGTEKLTEAISLKHNIKKLSDDDFYITPSSYFDGDLTKMIKRSVKDHDFNIQKQGLSSIEKSERMDYDGYSVITTCNLDSDNNTKALVYKDSFWDNMYYPFSLSIQKGVYVDKPHFSKQNVLEEIRKMGGKPDFIIYETVERYLPFLAHRHHFRQ